MVIIDILNILSEMIMRLYGIDRSKRIFRSNKWETYERNKYSYLPCLYNYNNVANLYCYLLSSLGWAERNI